MSKSKKQPSALHLHVRLLEEEARIVREQTRATGLNKTVWVRMLIRREGGLGSMLPPPRR